MILKNVRIPSQIDFAQAASAVPEAPKMVEKSARQRVKVNERALNLFETCAGGYEMEKDEREAFTAAMPLPNSLLALPPRLDDNFPAIIPTSARITDPALRTTQGSLLAAMSGITMALSEVYSEQDLLEEKTISKGECLYTL